MRRSTSVMDQRELPCSFVAPTPKYETLLTPVSHQVASVCVRVLFLVSQSRESLTIIICTRASIHATANDAGRSHTRSRVRALVLYYHTCIGNLVSYNGVRCSPSTVPYRSRWAIVTHAPQQLPHCCEISLHPLSRGGL